MRILYGVQGTGNGHISRCRLIAQSLQAAGAEVDYVFSGREAAAYFDMQAFGDYRALPGLTFAHLSPTPVANHRRLEQNCIFSKTAPCVPAHCLYLQNSASAQQPCAG